MKKNLLYKVIAFVLCISMVCGVLLIVNNSNTVDIYAYDQVLAERVEELDNIKNEICVNLFSKFYRTMKFDSKYPDNYAGAYIDENNVLNICYTNNGDEYRKILTKKEIDNSIENVISTILSVEDNSALSVESKSSLSVENNLKKSISIEEVKTSVNNYLLATFDNKTVYAIDDFVKYKEDRFSLNYLLKIQDALYGKMGGFSIIKSSIIEPTNSVDIYISKDSKDEILKHLDSTILDFNPDSVKFYFSDEEYIFSLNSNTAVAGTKIRTPSTGFLGLGGYNYGTIGFNAYFNGQKGVVTNYHVAPLGITMRNGNNTTIGETTWGYIHNDTGSDFAFVKFSNQSNWSVVADVTASESTNPGQSGTIARVAYSNEFLTGSNVVKYGMTTGYTNGTLISVNAQRRIAFSDELGGVREMKDMLEYSNESIAGDSGGPVGFQNVKGIYRLAGIHFAGGTTGFATKYKHIYSQGITAVTTMTNGGVYK